jgi:hypothetical protein
LDPCKCVVASDLRLGREISWVGRTALRRPTTARTKEQRQMSDDVRHEIDACDASWLDLLGRLQAASEAVRRAASEQPLAHVPSGFVQLLRYLHSATDAGVTHPLFPEFASYNGLTMKWGLDNPDALYASAPIDPSHHYRVWGTRGTVRYVGFNVRQGMYGDSGGIGVSASFRPEDMGVAADGGFEFFLGPPDRPGAIALDPRSTALSVRQFFYDWENEVPAVLRIECLDSDEVAPPRPTSADVAEMFDRVARFASESPEIWRSHVEQRRGHGVNTIYQRPGNEAGHLGTPDQAYGSCYWEVGPEEALVFEVTPPECVYWNVQLGDHWFASLDYVYRQSSLNGHQAVLDDDGCFRAVIAHRDPGFANWLDPAGNTCGTMVYRWNNATSAPVPSLVKVAFDELSNRLPDTHKITPSERRTQLRARRDGALKRFHR